MKTSLVVILGAAITAITAQDLSSLAQCEQTCVNNMVNLGPSLGCPANDNGSSNPVCLCSLQNFAYGIIDCSSQSCPNGTDLGAVSNYGAEYCSSAAASASGTSLSAINLFTSAAAAASSSSRTTTTTTTSSTSSTSTSTSTSTTSTTSSTRHPITTIPILTTFTSGGSTITSTAGSITINEGESFTSSAVTTVPIISTVTTGGSTVTTTVGSSTSFAVVTASSSEGSAAARATWDAMGLLAVFGALVL